MATAHASSFRTTAWQSILRDILPHSVSIKTTDLLSFGTFDDIVRMLERECQMPYGALDSSRDMIRAELVMRLTEATIDLRRKKTQHAKSKKLRNVQLNDADVRTEDRSQGKKAFLNGKRAFQVDNSASKKKFEPAESPEQIFEQMKPSCQSMDTSQMTQDTIDTFKVAHTQNTDLQSVQGRVDPFKAAYENMNASQMTQNKIDTFKVAHTQNTDLQSVQGRVDPFKAAYENMNASQMTQNKIDTFKVAHTQNTDLQSVQGRVDPFKAAYENMNASQMTQNKIDTFKVAHTQNTDLQSVQGQVDPFKAAYENMNASQMTQNKIDTFKVAHTQNTDLQSVQGRVDPFKAAYQNMDTSQMTQNTIDPFKAAQGKAEEFSKTICLGNYSEFIKLDDQYKAECDLRAAVKYLHLDTPHGKRICLNSLTQEVWTGVRTKQITMAVEDLQRGLRPWILRGQCILIGDDIEFIEPVANLAAEGDDDILQFDKIQDQYVADSWKVSSARAINLHTWLKKTITVKQRSEEAIRLLKSVPRGEYLLSQIASTLFISMSPTDFQVARYQIWKAMIVHDWLIKYDTGIHKFVVPCVKVNSESNAISSSASKTPMDPMTKSKSPSSASPASSIASHTPVTSSAPSVITRRCSTADRHVSSFSTTTTTSSVHRELLSESAAPRAAAKSEPTIISSFVSKASVDHMPTSKSPSSASPATPLVSSGSIASHTPVTSSAQLAPFKTTSTANLHTSNITTFRSDNPKLGVDVESLQPIDEKIPRPIPVQSMQRDQISALCIFLLSDPKFCVVVANRNLSGKIISRIRQENLTKEPFSLCPFDASNFVASLEEFERDPQAFVSVQSGVDFSSTPSYAMNWSQVRSFLSDTLREQSFITVLSQRKIVGKMLKELTSSMLTKLPFSLSEFDAELIIEARDQHDERLSAKS